MNRPHGFQRNGCCARISYCPGDNKLFPSEEDNEGRKLIHHSICKVKDGVQTSVWHMCLHKHSHKLPSKTTVSLGILDFSNGEGGSSIDGW